jgi:hypothetical protein
MQRTLIMTFLILGGLSFNVFGQGSPRLRLRFSCYCARAGKGYEPRQAHILYYPPPFTGQSRASDAVFVKIGENKYTLLSLGDHLLYGKEIVSYETKAECLAIFLGNEKKICDGHVSGRDE